MQAAHEARKSSQRCRHGAILLYRNKVVSRGYNRCYAQRRNGWLSRHAEIDALVRSRRLGQDMVMIVVRIDREENVRNSKPCKRCQKSLARCGIRVYYSTDDEEKK